MKTTGALAKRMQSLIASFHPPNPPTALESQQILGVLQKSFRKKLDYHHPHPSKLTSKSNILYDSPVIHDSSSTQAASDHFGSLLSHPILNPLIANDTKNDAVHRFDRLMAESRDDIPGLLSIMTQHIKEFKSGDNFSSRLDTWIRMTDVDSREIFFTNRLILNTALEIITKEDHEEFLWKWLELVYHQSGRILASEKLIPRVWLGVEDYMVSRLMKFAIQRHKISEAAEQFIQACKYRGSSGRGDPSSRHEHSNLPYAPMVRSAKRMASAVIFHRNQHGISPDAYDQMIEYLLPWTHDPTSSGAFCMLYHPIKPSADSIYKSLCHPHSAEVLMKAQEHVRPANRRAILTALLDGSKLSLAAGRRSQASFLLNFAIDHYPDYLPPRQLDAVELQLEVSLTFAAS